MKASKRKQKVIIVGAGMAGLTASAYLTKEDYDVLLFDKNARCGGLVSTYEKEGFFFDSGPRAFVNSGMIRPIIKDLGLEMEYVKNTVSIGIEDQKFDVTSLDSLEPYKEILIKLYPNSKKDIEKIIPMIVKLSEYTATLYEFDNPYFVDYTKDKKVFLKEFLPWTFRLLRVLKKFNQYNTPMEDFLKNMTDNESLINIITQSFFKQTPTYFALGYFHVYLDYFYPKQGTGSLPKTIEKMIREQGTKVQLNTEIEEVIPSEKTVVDTEGNRYVYDHLIWAADLKTLYQEINPKALKHNVRKKYEKQRSKVLSSKAAESIYSISIAVDKDPAYFSAISGEHMFYTPSKRGLNDIHMEKLVDLKNNFNQATKEEVLHWVEAYCDYNTYEISIPVLRDDSLAPKGKTGLLISFLFDYELIKKIDDKDWLEEVKTLIENRIIDNMSNSIFPNIKADVIYKFSSTPLTIEHISGNSEGAIVGWSFESKPPVYNKLKDIGKSATTPIKDIYKASQWAYAPAGVPIAMLTGWHATQEIIKQSKKKKS